MAQWEYVKGSEADFEGAPEWAVYVETTESTITGRRYFTEGHSVGDRYVSSNKPDYIELHDGDEEEPIIIAQRRKMPTDLYGTPLDLLYDHFKVPRDEISMSLQSRTNDANLQQAFDTIQRPAHYNQSGIECIDAIAASMTPAEFQAYLKGNVQKYLWRYQHKNGVEDVRKAQWYLDRLVKELSK